MDKQAQNNKQHTDKAFALCGVSKAEGDQLCNCVDKHIKHFISNLCEDCKRYIVRIA